MNGKTEVGGVLKPPCKPIVGHTGSEDSTVEEDRQFCGHDPETGCLFDVYTDPVENKNYSTLMLFSIPQRN